MRQGSHPPGGPVHSAYHVPLLPLEALHKLPIRSRRVVVAFSVLCAQVAAFTGESRSWPAAQLPADTACGGPARRMNNDQWAESRCSPVAASLSTCSTQSDVGATSERRLDDDDPTLLVPSLVDIGQ